MVVKLQTGGAALPHPVDFGDRLVLKLHDHREPGVLGSVPRVVLVQAFLNVHGEEGPDDGLWCSMVSAVGRRL